jgi:hypothetical protein
MKKFIIAVSVIFMLFVAGCTSTSKSIYEKNMTTPGADVTDYYTGDAKNFYPETVLPNDNEYVKSLNNNIDNYFKTNNITEYKYITTDGTMKIWISNWDSMTQTAKNKIKSDLTKMYANIKNFEFVKTKDEVK